MAEVVEPPSTAILFSTKEVPEASSSFRIFLRFERIHPASNGYSSSFMLIRLNLSYPSIPFTSKGTVCGASRSGSLPAKVRVFRPRLFSMSSRITG